MTTTLCVGDADHVRAAARHLSEAGIDATVVPDGEQARERAADDAVECVVTALHLPDQSGVQLAATIEDAAAVVCAANGDERTAGRVLAAGADGYVPADDIDAALVDQVAGVLPLEHGDGGGIDGEALERGDAVAESADGAPSADGAGVASSDEAGGFDAGVAGVAADDGAVDSHAGATAVRDDGREDQLAALHGGTLAMEADRDADAVREDAVAAAIDVLEADQSWIVERDDGAFVARTAAGDCPDATALPGRATRERLVDPAIDAGRTRIEYHLAADAAVPAEYGSGLAVPVDDATALVAVAHEPAAFDSSDEHLAELLVGTLAARLDRLRYEADLRRERDRIAALFDNVPNPIVRTRVENDRAIVEAVNPSFERVFGYDTDEIVGEVLDDHIVPPDRVERARALTRRGLDGETVETEVRRLTASGTRDFLLTVVPVSGDDGPSVNYAVYTDVTERKQRQQRLEVLNRVLRHDLRNGMNVVRGSAELLQERLDGEAVEHVDAIEARTAELIELADKTRTVEQTLQSEPGDVGPVDVVEAVETAIDRVEVDATGAELVTGTPDEAVARVGPMLPLAVEQVLENAFVHHDGEPTVEVAVRELDADRTVEVAVADDGPGIPETERKLVTEQRRITQLRHGSGLGLWIVNWVVTGSGGDLSIEANEPRGTVVRMRLPQAGADRCNLPVLLD